MKEDLGFQEGGEEKACGNWERDLQPAQRSWEKSLMMMTLQRTNQLLYFTIY